MVWGPHLTTVREIYILISSKAMRRRFRRSIVSNYLRFFGALCQAVNFCLLDGFGIALLECIFVVKCGIFWWLARTKKINFFFSGFDRPHHPDRLPPSS